MRRYLCPYVLEPYACGIGGVFMESYLNSEMLGVVLAAVITYGFIPGFMLATILHLLGYGIFKGIALLNIRS